MRLISATYKLPFLNATPHGVFRPEAMVYTFSATPFLSLSTAANTLPPPILPTNKVPFEPQHILRALGTSAKTLILNPGSSLILSRLYFANRLSGLPVVVRVVSVLWLVVDASFSLQENRFSSIIPANKTRVN